MEETPEKKYKLYHWNGLKSYSFFHKKEQYYSYDLIDIEDFVKSDTPLPQISNIPVLVPYKTRQERKVGVKEICILLFKHYSEAEVYDDIHNDGMMDYTEKDDIISSKESTKIKREIYDITPEGIISQIKPKERLFSPSITGGAGDEIGNGEHVKLDAIDISLLMKKPSKKMGLKK